MWPNRKPVAEVFLFLPTPVCPSFCLSPSLPRCLSSLPNLHDYSRHSFLYFPGTYPSSSLPNSSDNTSYTFHSIYCRNLSDTNLSLRPSNACPFLTSSLENLCLSDLPNQLQYLCSIPSTVDVPAEIHSPPTHVRPTSLPPTPTK